MTKLEVWFLKLGLARPCSLMNLLSTSRHYYSKHVVVATAVPMH